MSINNIILDCDGVLTTGSKEVGPDGRRNGITFHSRDNEAVKRLIEDGYRVIIVTASNYDGIFRYWTRFNVEVFTGIENKSELDTIAGFLWYESFGVGDDLMDARFLERCAMACVPADAHPELKKRFAVLDTRGGHGVVTEIEHRLKNIHALNGTTTIA